jgi:hypothetical protein
MIMKDQQFNVVWKIMHNYELAQLTKKVGQNYQKCIFYD